MTDSNKYAVIMAGGVGSRFWPVSTKSFPKQFHDMLGSGRSLLQQTYMRLQRQVPAENILVLTNAEYIDLVKEQLPTIPHLNIVAEPAMRNTAPCILLAALKIQKDNPDALMVVAPSDHDIKDGESYDKELEIAFNFCRENPHALLTLGITPDHPNTGYGYIEYGDEHSMGVRKVARFREKPKKKKAVKYLEAGNFLWNAGIFIWSVEGVVSAFAKAKQDLYQLFADGIDQLNTEQEKQFLVEYYPQAENISVDYAILENSDQVFVKPVDFGWSDLGTWGSLHKRLDHDVNGNTPINVSLVTENARDNLIYSETGKKVVIQGLSNLIVVEKNDMLLVLPMEEQQEIKKLRKQTIKEMGDHLG